MPQLELFHFTFISASSDKCAANSDGFEGDDEEKLWKIFEIKMSNKKFDVINIPVHLMGTFKPF